MGGRLVSIGGIPNQLPHVQRNNKQTHSLKGKSGVKVIDSLEVWSVLQHPFIFVILMEILE
jgi:hypothetical protein